MSRETLEIIAFVLYLAVVLCVGVVFFLKGRKSLGGEKEYFLGGRKLNGWVAALSAGASDMSAWVLMGLPGSIYFYGMGQVWISIGLFIGTILAWIFVAPRLRRFSIESNDSITIPQYLTNRFKSNNRLLLIVCAVIFLVAYCIYAASSIVACGELFNTVFGFDKTWAMIGATAIILVYTFLGGFNAVCWTDFIQGMLMLIALMAVPIIACFAMGEAGFTPVAAVVTGENYYNFLSSGKFDWQSISDILSGLGWGLGYFGMPHILVRYMSIRSEKEMKKSRVVGIFWTGLIILMASVVALVAHEYLGNALDSSSKDLVFIHMVRGLMPAFIGGLLLSAILAASMSTADSQLLTSASAFSADVYKPVFRKNASSKEMLIVGRVVVAIISVIALLIATSPACSGIMKLVSNAWGAFGAAFGPSILLSLYWKRFTYKGALAGVVVGFVVDIVWLIFLFPITNVYEIIPGFIAGLIAAVLVTLMTKKPSAEVEQLFDNASVKRED